MYNDLGDVILEAVCFGFVFLLLKDGSPEKKSQLNSHLPCVFPFQDFHLLLMTFSGLPLESETFQS